MTVTDSKVIKRLLGVDVYLIDLILEGRFASGSRIVDLGAGGGRNLTWFLSSEAAYDVHVVEPNAELLHAFKDRQAQLGVDLPEENIHRCTIEDCTLEARSFDLVILNAVLHFARDEEHFAELFRRAFDLVAAGGVFFARLATTIGIESFVGGSASGWYSLPDGTQRFLADEALVRSETQRAGAKWVRPFKSTLVERQRTMSTWVLSRPAHP